MLVLDGTFHKAYERGHSQVRYLYLWTKGNTYCSVSLYNKYGDPKQNAVIFSLLGNHRGRHLVFFYAFEFTVSFCDTSPGAPTRL